MKTPMQVKSARSKYIIEQYIDEQFEKQCLENESISIDVPQSWNSDDLMIADAFLKSYGWDSVLGERMNMHPKEITVRVINIFPYHEDIKTLEEGALVAKLSENIAIVNSDRIKIEESNPYEELEKGENDV